MIRPIGTRVLLEAMPYKPSITTKIVLPEGREPDIWEYRVIACGPKVSFDLQPGQRILIDPTLLDQRDFEFGGRKFKLVERSSIQMVIGERGE